MREQKQKERLERNWASSHPPPVIPTMLARFSPTLSTTTVDSTYFASQDGNDEQRENGS
jgi:hypothetical protein